MRRRGEILLLMLAAAAGCAEEAVSPAPPAVEVAARTFAVVRVIDGDTFVIEYDGEPTSVRLLGIDAPEPREPGGAEATAALRQLISGRTVRLTFSGPRKRDNFGRLLADVTVDGRDVAAELRARGHVKAEE